MRVRRFTDKGLDAFRVELARLREFPSAVPNEDLMSAADLTEELPGGTEPSPRVLATKREAAEYLAAALSGAGPTAVLLSDANLWAWLSWFLFDSVCPAVEGRRKVRVDANYIPEIHTAFRRYRHLLRTPYLVYEEVPAPNRILLDAPLATQGDVVEHMAGRLWVMRVSTLREAIDRLYFDNDRRAVKRGAVSGRSPASGDLRHRFFSRVVQLRLVYDIESLTVDQLLDLLGDEFRRWRSE